MAFGFATTSIAAPPNGTQTVKSYQDLKTTLHRELLNKIDLERLTSLQDVRARTVKLCATPLKHRASKR